MVPAAVTRSLLGYGVLAGPFYLALGVAQGLIRDGFSFARHPLSVLANGPGGWVQSANLAVSALMVLAAVVGTVACALVFEALGSWGPWADAWIFTGSLLATYGMARGWTEFWLVWIAVDLVGVPLLLSAGYYPSAVLYAVYGAVVAYGFSVWLRAQRVDGASGAGGGRVADAGTEVAVGRLGSAP